MEAAGIRTSTPESGDIEQLRESSGGCGLLLELEESGRLEHAPEVERVLQLCAQVAAIHTQKEFLDACNPPKGCPGCFWVFFAVCLEQHPDLSDVIARVIENLLHDRCRNIVTLVMAPMRLIRAAWSREGDARCAMRDATPLWATVSTSRQKLTALVCSDMANCFWAPIMAVTALFRKGREISC